MAFKKKLKKIETNQTTQDSVSDDTVNEAYKNFYLRNFVRNIGLDWINLNGKQIDKIAKTKQYKQWVRLQKNKKLGKKGKLEESGRSFSLHRVNRPHSRPEETPKSDVGQVKKSIPGKQPFTTYKKIATSVINRGGSVTRSPGSITYKGRKGKFAYKATKHAQLGLGGRRLTIQPHKGVAIHGNAAKKLTAFSSSPRKKLPIFKNKEYEMYKDSYEQSFYANQMNEDGIASKEAHHNLIKNGFIIKREGKHRIYQHKNKKIKISLSRTGILSDGQTKIYKKAMNLATISENDDKNIQTLNISKKTEKVLEKGKQILKRDKNIPNKEITKFQYKKTLSGSSNSGKNNETDIIELNPDMNPENDVIEK